MAVKNDTVEHVIEKSSKAKDYYACITYILYVNLDTWNSLSIVPILVSPAIFVIISSWKGNKTRKEDVSTKASPRRGVQSTGN